MKVAIEETPPYKRQSCTLGNEEWNVPRLVALSADLPVYDAQLASLCLANTVYRENMRGMVSHMKNVLDADLKKPIILDEDGDIMDGRHRIMKALLEGKETIKAVRFDKNPTPCRVNGD